VLVAAVPRHLAAWARGCCYLHAGNNCQALKDAQAAMAYAAAAAATTRPAACADTLEAAAAQPGNAALTGCTVSSSSSSSGVLQVQPTQPTTAAAAAASPAPACRWVPALLLAAEAYAALEQWPQAVVHCAAAAVLQAPGQATTAERLAVMARQLLPEQAVAFRSGGLAGLLQQLQLEAELKLPEVMRPRPKW
jgi:hypothetical protein